MTSEWSIRFGIMGTNNDLWQFSMNKNTREGRIVTQRLDDQLMDLMGEAKECLILIYAQGTDLGKRFDLDKDEMVIGRDPKNDISLYDETVSRNHVRIERKKDRIILADLNSTNGTFVNEVQLEPGSHCPIKDGDRIRVGRAIFKYLSGNAVESHYYAEIHKMAVTDGLTDLHNNRFFQESLVKEASRSRRYKRPLSLIMIDIDNFKKVNDEHGHLAGDSVLRNLGDLLKAIVRKEEIIARYGGEEFAVLLPETNKKGAASAAEKIRRVIEKKEFIFGERKIKVTVSAGISEISESDFDTDEMIRFADERLYQAKKEGRNRVMAGRPINT